MKAVPGRPKRTRELLGGFNARDSRRYRGVLPAETLRTTLGQSRVRDKRSASGKVTHHVGHEC